MPTIRELANNPEFLSQFNGLSKEERIKFINKMQDSDPEFVSTYKQLPTTERFKFLDKLEAHQPTEMYGKLKEAQVKAADTMGSFAQRASEAVGKLPAALSNVTAPLVLGAAAGKTAIEHPKAALITGGALATLPITVPLAAAGGTGATVAAALGTGAGAGLGDLASQIGEQILRSPGRETTPSGVAKEAGIVAGTTALTELGGAVAIKGGAKFLSKIFSKPNLKAAEEAVTKTKDAIQKAKTMSKEMYTRALDEAKNIEAASGKAIGEAEDITGLSKFKQIDRIPDITETPQFARDMSKIAKESKETSTGSLYNTAKKIKATFDTYKGRMDKFVEKELRDSVDTIRTELRSRVPEYDKAIKVNKLARENISNIKPSKLLEEGAKQDHIAAIKEAKVVKGQLKEKEAAIKKIKKIALGIALTGGAAKYGRPILKLTGN